MPTFGTVTRPVRNHPAHPININSPDGYMTEPPGDLWWLGLHDDLAGAVASSVTRATSIIVNPLVRMPWVITQPDGRQLRPGEPDYPTWLTDPMLLNGASGGNNLGMFPMLDRTDRFDLFARWLRDALWFGVGLLLFTPGSDGLPRAGTVRVIEPTRLNRATDLADPHWALEHGGTMLRIDDDGTIQGMGDRVVPLRHSLPGGVFGRHRMQLQLAREVSSYALDTFDSGVPSGILTTEQPITKAQADPMREEWEDTEHRRRTRILGYGAKYQQVVMSPLDAQIVDMARLSNEQVAHMFELPAWHLDAATNSMTYTNAAWNRQDLVDGPLASWSARLSETVGALFPWGTTMDIDFTTYTTPTTPSEAPSGPTDPA